VNSSGAIGTSYTYQPFGATTTGGSANGNSYEFTGRENDATGLYFYRARYYSSTYQRFVSQDPSDFAGGDTNLYSYVGDSPIDLIDPAGLYWDLNFTFGWLMPFFPYFPALTTGLQFDQCGVHPYIGGGEASPGPSVSLTYSPGNASLGGRRSPGSRRRTRVAAGLRCTRWIFFRGWYRDARSFRYGLRRFFRRVLVAVRFILVAGSELWLSLNPRRATSNDGQK